MSEQKQVRFYSYEIDGEAAGFVVEPESDTKMVFIPSPPTTTYQKINPRRAVLAITGGRICDTFEGLEQLKAYCADQKLVMVCPESVDPEEVSDTYEYMMTAARDLNIKRNELTVAADADHLDDANAVMEYLMDELDVEFDQDEAEELPL